MGTTPTAHPGIERALAEIPGLGAIADAWRHLAGVEDRGLDDAVGLLAHDAVLSGPVMGWCRSSAGESSSRVTTPHRAVIMQGVGPVREAVLGVSAFAALRGLGSGVVDADGFWTHALGVSACCEALAGEDESSTAGLAGLLHDAGKLVLAAADPTLFAEVIETCESRGTGAGPALRHAFGMDHHTAGKRLAERWGLDARVRDAVWHHGQGPEGVPASGDAWLVGVVTAGKAWARSMMLGWSGEFDAPPDAGSLAHASGVPDDELGEMNERVVGVLRERARALGVGGADPMAWSAAESLRRSAAMARRVRELSERGERDRQVLDAIASFQLNAGAWGDPEQVVGAIGASACGLLGVGKVAAVWQERPGAGWKLSLVDGEGRGDRPRDVASPARDAPIRRPADLATAHASSVLASCDLAWLARLIEHLREAGTPALVGVGAAGTEGGASCVVLAPVARAAHDHASLAPVRGVWGWALERACGQSAARGLEEELAQVNRQLIETRDDLAAKQSMVRLGQMAAGAAHELNNPLTVIRGRAQMISERASTPKQREDAAAIGEAAQQVSDMVTSLHLLSVPPKIRAADCDPLLVLRDAVDRARARVPEKARRSRVRLHAEGMPHSMRLDPELTAQALSEPIANALMARPGGEVHISAESEAFTDRLKVRVIDRGPGFSVSSLTHAFDPFFSEQPAGRRAGLGLARCRSLAELMNGGIEIGNNPGDIGGAFAELVIPQAIERKRAA